MTQTKVYIEEKAMLIHQALDRFINELPHVPNTIRDAMSYSLLAGGKRIRPVLTFATVKALGNHSQNIMPFACAIEMIHTYSLIHDDLPAMDNDDYRRGKLTNHKVYGEAVAILAGDALLTEAFGLFAKGARESNLPVDVATDIILEATRYAGARGMIAGQALDLANENKEITLAQLEEIHLRKTADLIIFAVRVGARITDASPESLDALTKFAYKLGLAFQIKDDILDVIGDQNLIGKPVGSDEGNKKATYPAILGLATSEHKLHTCIAEAREAIQQQEGIDPTLLLEIADYLLLRDR